MKTNKALVPAILLLTWVTVPVKNYPICERDYIKFCFSLPLLSCVHVRMLFLDHMFSCMSVEIQLITNLSLWPLTIDYGHLINLWQNQYEKVLFHSLIVNFLQQIKGPKPIIKCQAPSHVSLLSWKLILIFSTTKMNYHFPKIFNTKYFC